MCLESFDNDRLNGKFIEVLFYATHNLLAMFNALQQLFCISIAIKGGGQQCFWMHNQASAHMLYYTAQFCSLVCGVLAPGQLLLSPKETVAAPLPKHLVFIWWNSAIQL